MQNVFYAYCGSTQKIGIKCGASCFEEGDFGHVYIGEVLANDTFFGFLANGNKIIPTFVDTLYLMRKI